ncbi:MAG: hypothetical protein A2W91_06795 [Bacteroidetes bacterium GWF2_38_335]|nr:MAG: hypothetical protein A2W91_06795 [Bacteroidetes bacterium GWF2_38_335]OFY80914.1 MAG: hypothetical protein A2281_04910 [Bacteroidetes bacterium RIFOXYA12_FULL_38_20]HBS84924.1 peptidylprolyl isomerase [Bacteroidales bacterium]
MIVKAIGVLIIMILVSSCFKGVKKDVNEIAKEKFVVVSTTYGDIKIKLYDKTPLHRDNFLKLADSGYYDSLLFHRVIETFMVQGGDPDSKNAKQGIALGNGDPGYTIPAEFVPEYFHKKGVIAAARESDDLNPEKRSSGSQFYIVQGKVFTPEQISNMENSMNQQLKQQVLVQYVRDPANSAFFHKADSLMKKRKTEEFEKLQAAETGLQELYKKITPFKFSEEQVKIYTTIGGAPHLDGNYTVFGEVVSGLEVIDKIAAVKTDKNNRPVVDVMMKVRVVEE